MSVSVTRLPSGLTIVTDSMPQVETVSLGAWVGVGTRDEQPEINGIAHLLEHMAFKGTTRRSARDIAEAIEDVGGHLNAYTSREQTAYYAKILAEDTPLAVDIISDILANSVFDEDELRRERAVVLQEIGQANDTPDDIIFDHFQATAFADQQLGRPVLGTAEIVSRLSREDLFGYLARHYRAPSMVAAAAGKVDHTQFVDLVGDRFGAVAGTGKPAAPVGTQEPARYTGGAYRESRDLEQVHLVVGFPGVAAADPAYYALSVYSTILGGGMSSRLFQEIREKRGLVYSVYSFASSFRDTGLLGIYAGTGEEEMAELVPVLADELRKLPDTVSEDEMRRAKAQLRATTLMARESTAARAESAAQSLFVHGRVVPVEETLAKLEAVTLEDIRATAATLLGTTPTVAMLGPDQPAGAADPMDVLSRRLAA